MKLKIKWIWTFEYEFGQYEITTPGTTTPIDNSGMAIFVRDNKLHLDSTAINLNEFEQFEIEKYNTATQETIIEQFDNAFNFIEYLITNTQLFKSPTRQYVAINYDGELITNHIFNKYEGAECAIEEMLNQCVFAQYEIDECYVGEIIPARADYPTNINTIK